MMCKATQIKTNGGHASDSRLFMLQRFIVSEGASHQEIDFLPAGHPEQIFAI
jgi:hypothetical protein